jgi:hypothetical protein
MIHTVILEDSFEKNTQSSQLVHVHYACHIATTLGSVICDIKRILIYVKQITPRQYPRTLRCMLAKRSRDIDCTRCVVGCNRCTRLAAKYL